MPQSVDIVCWSCILQLCQTCLLFLVVSVCVYSLVLSLYNTVSSANRDGFTISFPVLMPFTCFSSSVFLNGTYCTVLTRNGKSGHSCLNSHLGGKAFSFNYYVCCDLWAFVDGLYQVKEVSYCF